MAGYAAGKRALGICDRCGQSFLLNTLRKEWTGFKVCSQCYEPKHPQLEPKRTINEPIALMQPRPDRPQAMVVYVGVPNDTSFTSNGMMPTVPSKALVAGCELGNVKVVAA